MSYYKPTSIELASIMEQVNANPNWHDQDDREVYEVLVNFPDSKPLVVGVTFGSLLPGCYGWETTNQYDAAIRI